MNLDFPTILVLLTAITGIIWAADALVWAPRRRARAVEVAREGGVTELPKEKAATKEPLLVEYARSFFPIILVVLLVRSFVVEPFRIPSGSMMPTLLVGDFILVNKFAYGIRLPVINTKVINLGSPKRGDVIVFRYPENPSVDYIKRVVGVPGDHIAYRDKVLYINGVRQDQKRIDTYVGKGAGAMMTGASLRQENLSGDEHRILILTDSFDRDFDFTVPAGQYFVMGDNRDNSRDSRYWGTVPDANLVGKAFFVWMNWDSADDSVGWGRLGTVIH
jgi:signal peptidase I